MILTQVVLPATLFRVNTPQWAWMPLSGAGAAAAGGRFNRPGLHALYLALDSATALAEYQQTSTYLQPGTICTYTATVSPLVDLRLLDQGAWDPLWQDWSIDWRYMKQFQHIDPPTWDMGDFAVDAGSPGIIFPSTVHAGGANVVLFLDALAAAGDEITVFDPNALLPQNSKSWT